MEKLSVSKGQVWAAGSSFPTLLATAHHLFFLLQSLPFQKIQHSITAQDHQPTPDSCIISMVVGQLKVMVLLPCSTTVLVLRDTQTSDAWSFSAQYSSHQPHGVIF